MKVTVFPNIVGVPRTDLDKRLEELKMRGTIETVQTITLIRLARILSRDFET